MKKKIMLLALGAVSAMMLAVPATASATLQSLHMSPTPAKMDIAGGSVTLRSNIGTIGCNGATGSTTPEAGGTTGTVQLRFIDCTVVGGFCASTNPAEPNGSIATTVLSYHLVTLAGKQPGILITPGVNGVFFHATCAGFPYSWAGNGLLGTITAPGCEGESKVLTLSFKAVSGTTTQQHRQVAGLTEGTLWNLSSNGSPASLEMQMSLTLTDGAGQVFNSWLVCT